MSKAFVVPKTIAITDFPMLKVFVINFRPLVTQLRQGFLLGKLYCPVLVGSCFRT